MLETTEDPNGIIEAATQFSAIIEKHIIASFGDSMYSRALEEMDVLRGEMLEMEEPQLWNTWIRELKDKLLRGKLGEGREELWWKMRKERLGLITHEEDKMSDVTENEAKLVCMVMSETCGNSLTFRFSSYHHDNKEIGISTCYSITRVFYAAATQSCTAVEFDHWESAVRNVSI
jgi:hypothetical protein